MNREDYPLMLTVKDIQEILRIGQGASYHLLHQNAFPVLKVGNQFRIPRDAFFAWTAEAAQKLTAPCIDRNSILFQIQNGGF